MAGDVDGAIENWKKAVELKPDFGFPLYNLGLAFLAKGDKTEALDYLPGTRKVLFLPSAAGTGEARCTDPKMQRKRGSLWEQDKI